MTAPANPQNRPAGAAWIDGQPPEPVRAWFVHPTRPQEGWLAGVVIGGDGQHLDVARTGIPSPVRLPRNAVIVSPLAAQQVVDLLTAGGVARNPGFPDLAIWPGDPDRTVRVLEPGAGWALIRPGLTDVGWTQIVGTGYLGAAPAPGWVALRPDPDRWQQRRPWRLRRRRPA